MPRQRVYEHIEVVFGAGWNRTRPMGLNRGFRPNLDSFHTADPHELTVIVELAGIDPASLTVAISDRTLVVTGERVRTPSQGRIYQQMEIEYGPFERRVRLAEDVDPRAASARFELGLLTISLPVAGTRPEPERERRRISVEHE
jgi:HSP20 family protein